MMLDRTHAPLPLISVIVAVYNGAATLQQCIDSIAAQTYPHVEFILIDGASKDATLDIVKANEANIACWMSEPDSGIYDAWNKGLCKANGDWVCFLGADDYLWSDYALERTAAALAVLSPDIRIAYGQVMLLGQGDKPLFPIGEPWGSVKKKFKQVMCIPHPGLMHRRSLFKDNGCFNDAFKIAGDYELMLRELLVAEAKFLPEITVVGMRQGGVSSTPGNTLRSLMEVRRAQKMHGLSLPGMHWMLAVARIYIRITLWRLLGERHARRVLDFGRKLNGQAPYWTLN
jgi:glycosyltransferase involved in cell wall biosynthesis